ncbi:MAG: glycosyltransferase family 1 protein [Cyanobacteria bacterium J06581_3]
MRILYDGQIYTKQTTGGINRYFTNIINRLPQDVYPILTTQHRKNKLHYPVHPNLTLKEYWGFRPHRLSLKARATYFRWVNNNFSFDIHHPTYYSRLTQDSFNRLCSPLVITVYDMIHEIFSDIIDPKGHTIRAKRRAITAADVLLCISHSTKADLLKYFPQVENKTRVIYLASEFKEDWTYGEEPVPTIPYFLYVGSRYTAYKNFDTLLLAFSKVASISPDVCLSVVGGPFSEEEQKLIAKLNLSSRIQHYSWASDTHLAKLYRCAEALVYPSSYEGFGIPPLEAMACGTVVVAADSSSIPEVVGDAGILFDPKAVNDLADILAYLLDSQGEREKLINRGYKQAQKFSWSITAEQTMQVYRSLL